MRKKREHENQMNKKHETLQSSLKYGKNHEAAQHWKHVNIKLSSVVKSLVCITHPKKVENLIFAINLERKMNQ